MCYIFGVNTDDNRYLVKAAALEVKPLLSLTVNGEKQFIMIQLLKQITAHFCEHVQLFSFSNFIDSLSSLTYSFWATLSFCSLVLHCSLVHLFNLVYFNRLSFYLLGYLLKNNTAVVDFSKLAVLFLKNLCS